MKPPASVMRLEPLEADALDGDDRDLLRGRLPVADRYLTGEPDAPPLPGVLGLLAHHPRLAGDWLAFSAGLLDDPVLDPRDRELLILRVSWRTQCRYEWAQHSRMALAVGLDPDRVAAVAGPIDASDWEQRERDLLTAADQLIDSHRVTDEIWGSLAQRFEERQLVELLFVVGSYLCLALVLNSAGLEPDPGSDRDGAALPGLEA